MDGFHMLCLDDCAGERYVMRTLAICLLVCLLMIGSVSAITFTKITPTPTIKLVVFPTTATGTLNILLDPPKGTLEVNGVRHDESWGKSELSLSLPPGTYNICYYPLFWTNEGSFGAVGNWVNRTATVTAGQTTTVSITGSPKGSIVFDSVEPKGGDLYIDDHWLSYDIPNVAFQEQRDPGSHTIRYIKGGYPPYSTTVTVNPLQATHVNIALQPAPAANPPAAAAQTSLSIATNKPSVIQGSKFTVTITGTASKYYDLYVMNTPMSPGTVYPVIDSGQEGVDASENVRAALATTILAGEMANYPGAVALIRTSSSGSRSVQFSTSATTGSGAAGKYYTIKTVNGDNIQDIAMVDVRVDPAVDADFTASPVSGNSPLAVQFTDISTGSPDTWSWDFGDGTPVVTGRNPVHTYQNQGLYSVTLTASKVAMQGNSDVVSKTGYIQVTAPGTSVQNPVANPVMTAPSTGSLAVSSTPGSAAVLLQGNVMGATPVTIPGIVPGTYPVKVMLTGYPEYSTTATIGAGQVTVLNVNFSSPGQPFPVQPPVTPQPVMSQSTAPVPGTNPPGVSGTGSLSVTTLPAGAKVYADEVMVGVTPATIPGLPAGPHTIHLVKDGYEDLVATVTIIPDQTLEYRTSLTPKTTIIGGVKIPGLNKVPGFGAGLTCAGLCICGILCRIFVRDNSQ
jgi:PKD repeat protein